MPESIVSLGATVQLVALAVGIIVIIIMGARIMGQGPKGFSSAIMEIGSLLIALYIIMRPNDVATLLSKGIGGVQTPTAIK